jgi:serine/threonine protein kinase
MPNMLAPREAESSRSRSRQRARTEANEHRSMWNRLSLQKIGSWLKREEEEPPPPAARPEKLGLHTDEGNKENGRPHSSAEHHGRIGGLLNRRSSRKAVPELPRLPTVKRMNSEKREKLLPVPVDGEQRRAASADRQKSNAVKRNLSVPRLSVPSMSAPDVLSPHNSESHQKPQPTIGGGRDSNIPAGARQVDYGMDESVDYLSVAAEPPPLSIMADSFCDKESQRSSSDIDEIQLQEELEAKWILNLSMHFRDLSDREKFFVTYAEEPTKWRRVTVSCDYRDLSPDSLESDLKSLHYQRDKSARIYEAIRDSLPDIQFYDTVTNLKLQTSDGRLHVHVTEDVNEIIPYPSVSAIDHLSCKKFKESAISFDSHISGFVYKVDVNHKVFIKKEIPGPDAVEEFLYEINALCSLRDAKSVIKFEGIIVDENNELIKGLLISYADQGALVDMLYDYKNSDLMLWERREKWARQIVQGLSEIHEAGFVQGDFTLSNIVIDRNDDAKIIDINRRGCPVGWEPPELAKLIESGQRISIYIGVKSDLFQLGMVLWAIAEQQDEPERQERPLYRMFTRSSTIPAYFRDLVKACLSDSPRDRPTATNILARFPDVLSDQPLPSKTNHQSVSAHRAMDKEYIDPATAVDLEDISQRRRRSRSSFSNVHMPSTEYVGSNGSYVMPNLNAMRGRSPGILRSGSRNQQSDCSPYPAPRSIMSLDDSELENELASLPASRETRWEQVYVDGDTKLVQRGGGEIDTHDFASQEPKDVCITTPPGELDSSFIGSKKSDDSTPLSLSTLVEMPPPSKPTQQAASTTEVAEDTGAGSRPGKDPGHRRVPSAKASFSDRVHHLTPAEDPAHTLADLENEIAMNASISSMAPSRVGTGFSFAEHNTVPRRVVSWSEMHNPLWRVETGLTWPEQHAPPRRVETGLSIAERFGSPVHQDSGFAESDHLSYDADRMRESLEICDFNIADLALAQGRQKDIAGQERSWEDKDRTKFGEGIKGSELRVQSLPKAERRATEEVAREKPLEEKVSNTTIRPPSIMIPNFHHKAVDLSPSKRTEKDIQVQVGRETRLALEKKDAEFAKEITRAQDEKRRRSTGALV